MALSNMQSIVISMSLTICAVLFSAGVVYANMSSVNVSSKAAGFVILSKVKASAQAKHRNNVANIKEEEEASEAVYSELGPGAIYALTKRVHSQYSFTEDREDRVSTK